MMQRIGRTLKHWKSGVRLYIGLAIVAITVEVWWWTSVNYEGATAVTRMQEIYAWLGLALFAVAISIGPFFKLFPEVRGKHQWFDARRLLGVGGGWFALLHVLLTYGFLFEFVNPLDLPTQYQQSFAFGAVAMLIIAAMVATSFDAAFIRLGRWWFRLHRLVYVALIAILAHIFMIGVHATQSTVLVILTVVAGVILFMHLAQVRSRPNRYNTVGLLVATVALVAVFSYGYSNQRNASERGTSGYEAQ